MKVHHITTGSHLHQLVCRSGRAQLEETVGVRRISGAMTGEMAAVLCQPAAAADVKVSIGPGFYRALAACNPGGRYHVSIQAGISGVV